MRSSIKRAPARGTRLGACIVQRTTLAHECASVAEQPHGFAPAEQVARRRRPGEGSERARCSRAAAKLLYHLHDRPHRGLRLVNLDVVATLVGNQLLTTG